MLLELAFVHLQGGVKRVNYVWPCNPLVKHEHYQILSAGQYIVYYYYVIHNIYVRW